MLADDGTTLVIREGKRLRAVPANRKLEASDPAVQSDAPSRKSGWIDLGRVRVSVDPRSEWRQMLREVWRLQRDHFWTPDMSGIDWNAVFERYAPLLDRVATRGELSDLIWEMQGELGTSHAYEMGGDHRKPPSIALGHLAADLKLADDGASYEIVRIVAGDPWEAGADSPLNAVGVEAQVGDRIVAVNGLPVSQALPPQALLVHQAGAKVELTLAPKEKGAAPRTVLINALTDEVPARYREWVERNREWVHAQSGGRIGYFHLPDMQSHGFAEFHRYFSTECDHDALIVDLRYNRGGHVSQLLLEKIARRRSGYAVARWMRPSPYPGEAVAGPVVALTNEHAGSDGDIFSHNFKLMGLGPLVGTRTWGGVVGIWPRHQLVDGSETTQPEFSFWFNDVGFGVENYGTDPQIEVDNAPQDAAAGHDRQLETALATAQDLVEKTRPGLPDFGPRPSLVRTTVAAAALIALERGGNVRCDVASIALSRWMSAPRSRSTAVKAVETADRARAVWTDADRAWASRAAAEVEGASAAPAVFLARRAQLALERIGVRAPALARRRARRALAAVGRSSRDRGGIHRGRRRRPYRQRAAHQYPLAAGAVPGHLESRGLRRTGRPVTSSITATQLRRDHCAARSRGWRADCSRAQYTQRPPTRCAMRSSAFAARLVGAGGAAVCGTRRAHSASGRSGIRAGRHRRPVRARPRVRVPRHVGEHVSRCRQRAVACWRSSMRPARCCRASPCPMPRTSRRSARRPAKTPRPGCISWQPRSRRS